MEGKENIQGENVNSAENTSTGHEPHKHATPRLLIGVGAVLIILFGTIVWSQWGSDIKEACFGDGEICAVELPE